MNFKTLAAAAFALIISSPAFAATYDFSFDASAASSGDTSVMVTGTLDIGVPAPFFGNEDFFTQDISNVSITVTSDRFDPFLLDLNERTEGLIYSDGSVRFTTIGFASSISKGEIYCPDTCFQGSLFVLQPDPFSAGGIRFGSSTALLNAFTATLQVSAVPLPAGGVLLLSGLAGVIGLKRRKKRAA